jgi:UDP-N-acetylmuramoyl-L-alanyl-D-glutamate--2,6-diaminopimelate ligase
MSNSYKEEVTDIHWKAQDSHEESLLFYKLSNGSLAEEKFYERIREAKYKWLILNRKIAKLPERCSVLDESAWPGLQKEICDHLYPLPQIKYLAVTGTNGKTTTADLVLQIGELSGKRGLSIGTLGVRDRRGTILEFGLTSPSFIDLRKFLFTYGADKDFCVMETSSHALTQDRLYELKFDGAGWLSFSQDHLDYHKTMEAYFDAKCLLVNHLSPGAQLFVPADQTELQDELSKKHIKFSPVESLQGELPPFFRAKFNRNNLAVAQALISSVFGTAAISDLSKLTPPEGRFYIKTYKTNYIIVDFAHTPDALENVCQGIKESFPSHKLKILFGCGGDRDRAKRPLMGSVADRYADKIYVTSDNPRSEPPEEIINDIIKGVTSKEFLKIIERPEAVALAFKELGSYEVLLLAGKGHEDYILKQGIKYPYSDVEEVNKFLKGF